MCRIGNDYKSIQHFICKLSEMKTLAESRLTKGVKMFWGLQKAICAWLKTKNIHLALKVIKVIGVSWHRKAINVWSLFCCLCCEQFSMWYFCVCVCVSCPQSASSDVQTVSWLQEGGQSDAVCFRFKLLAPWSAGSTADTSSTQTSNWGGVCKAHRGAALNIVWYPLRWLWVSTQ